jgi:hypothetical protein
MLRGQQGPVRVADQLPSGNAVTRFNSRFALLVTRVVGSMWCAYAFGAFDLISLPSAIHSGIAAIISWIAQTFLQLVLLSVIMVGQSIQGKASDARSEQTYKDAESILSECLELQKHLAAQDEILGCLIEKQATPGMPFSDAVDSGSTDSKLSG